MATLSASHTADGVSDYYVYQQNIPFAKLFQLTLWLNYLICHVFEVERFSIAAQYLFLEIFSMYLDLLYLWTWYIHISELKFQKC